MNYTVIYTDRTTIAVSIKPDGSIEVRAPRGTPRRQIDSFVNSKADWIKEHRNKTAPTPKQSTVFNYGGLFRYRGVDYPLIAREGKYAGFDGKVFYMPSGMTAEGIRLTMIKIYKSLALPLFKESLKKYSAIMGLQYPSSVKITSAKKRWGSCSQKGGTNICFSWMLITVNDYCAEEVVVHELSHVRHPDHSVEFWAEVDKYLSDRATREKGLEAEYTKLYKEGWFSPVKG